MDKEVRGVQLLRVLPFDKVSGKEKHMFWRKLHSSVWALARRLSDQGIVWVDFIYLPNCKAETYVTVPNQLSTELSSFLKRRRKREKPKNIDFVPIDPDLRVVEMPMDIPVCELKLKFDNLFSVSKGEVKLPESLHLKPMEKARISFCLVPVSWSRWNFLKEGVIRKKVERGIHGRRGNVGTFHPFYLLLFLLDCFLGLFMNQAEKLDQFTPWLSNDTLRKLNDPLFKAYVRIASPQRCLPKLVRPFMGGGGDNQLTVHLLTRKEQRACLQEINEQRLSLYSISDFNPNLLSSREISQLVPLFSRSEWAYFSRKDARPNFR